MARASLRSVVSDRRGRSATPVPVALVNDVVAFEPDPVDVSPSHGIPTGCPAGFVGTFSFAARLTNTSATPLTALVVAVTTLTNGTSCPTPMAVPPASAPR